MRQYKYVERFLKRKSFADVFTQLGCKTDLKEWTEVFGMYLQIIRQLEFFKPEIIFDVGCGKRPTLATFLAYNLTSIDQFIAIDPQLNTDLCKETRKLSLFDCTLDEYMKNNDYNRYVKIMIVGNHSHVSKKEITNFIEQFDSWVYITCPCCVNNKLHNYRGEYYQDSYIWSPKNEIYTFKNL